MRDTSEPLAKRKRVELGSVSKSFHHLPSLPIDVRHLVYSRMPLFDRVIAARSSPEVASYFSNNRVQSLVKIGLVIRKKNVYVKVQFVDALYTEMHRIPDELVKTVARDILSNSGCRCVYCNDAWYDEVGDEKRETPQIRFYDNGVTFADFIFVTLGSFVDVCWFLMIKSAPVKGFVDLLQPPIGSRVAHSEPIEFHVVWHLHKSGKYRRNDPKLNLENWARWFEYADSPEEVNFNMNLGMFGLGGSDFESYSDDANKYAEPYTGPLGHIHQDLFDLPAVQNAAKVTIGDYCNVDISDQQLMSMKATSIHLRSCGDYLSSRLTGLGVLNFYKSKIKEWLMNPCTEFEFYLNLMFGVFDATTEDPPYVDIRLVLEDVQELLVSPHIRLYRNLVTEGDLPILFIRNTKLEKGLQLSKYNIRTMDKQTELKDVFCDWPSKKAFKRATLGV